MMNLPENSPQPSAIPVGANGEALASNSPGMHPTCAPGALICPTRYELNLHWLNTMPGYAAINEWYALLKYLDASPMKPALN